ncbi:MAG: hypothetical protein A3H51_02075 [Candidatus Spechtbacteria bacterium RIFCSPLOWO2_02_FULL_38_8]|uniref:Uncharacterized protein n=1 Tax=Candidatus Spechtbacteria bacterium RIFCSPLOWO2_02_FULL_38_8 TaxID=1802164 RepID=A0A1G2HJ25_9BACT|nr:MAG: hypothetical protein A3H51_02075 [Candidatus Spechtbacteria bacterium RIFCSPLOWO2_02_FULL_38_8]
MARNTHITTADEAFRVARQRADTGGSDDAQKFNPFWAAVNAAKRITVRSPEDGQAELFAELEAAVSMLDENEKGKAPWRLVIPVFNEEVHIGGLFALARACGRTAMAHSVAAIVKAKRLSNLTTGDLEKFGLVETRVSDDGSRSWLQPMIGKEAITSAAEKMAEAGLVEGARALRVYLNKASVNRATGIARREAKSSASSSDEAPVTSEESSDSDES